MTGHTRWPFRHNGIWGNVKEIMIKVCQKCMGRVYRERSRELRKKYPYYCPYCDENMYSFECRDIVQNREDGKNLGQITQEDRKVRS